MPKRKANAVPKPKPAPDNRAVNARGQEWTAKRLTGNRAQRGNLPGGGPCWTYEVEWQGNWKNTFEPASNLVGWEKEMKAVDGKVRDRLLLPKVSPVAEALKVREAAAKQKAEETRKRVDRLKRLKRRRRARAGDAEGEGSGEEDEELSDSDGEQDDETDAALDDTELAAELARLEGYLQMLVGGGAAAAAMAAAAAATGAELGDAAATLSGVAQGPAHKRKRAGRSIVWKCFDRETNKCTLPHPTDEGRKCGALPDPGTGTSGHISHLEKMHSDEWLHVKVHGERKPTANIIADALAAQQDQSKPALGESESNELDRLVARWIAKCGRSQGIVEDKELGELLARILELCRARCRYALPTKMTVHRHLQLLGVEGKVNARNFIVRCMLSGVKISITGDLWSENGMGLFGIYAHGMPEFKMEKALIGLVACESERHTAYNIEKWTDEALEAIGLKVSSLLGTDTDADPVSAVTLNRLKPADLARLGIAADIAEPDDFIFKKVSDNGSNMKAAWCDGADDSNWVPCIDHTIELCTLPFTYVQKCANGTDLAIPRGSVAESFSKGRGLVGYLHHSTIGLSDFHACQKRVGLEEEKIDQDVKTRWRTAHNMGDQLVYNKPAVLEMDKNPKYKEAGETWGKNKLSFVDWDHLEESSACLMEAAVGSQLLEGDEYPTSSLVIPTVFRLMSYSSDKHNVYFRNRDEDEYNDAASNPVTVPHTDLQVKVREARKLYHGRLITRFDTELPYSVKKFWFVSSMLDPRFKKLSFDGDNMLKPAMRRDAVKWLTEEYNANFKGKVHDATAAADAPAANDAAPAAPATPEQGHQKRRKVSASSFFTPRVAGAAHTAAPVVDTPRAADSPHADELAAYLALPQIEYETEWDALDWWKENSKKFPNLSVMAHQYLGCPASSATVERLFSQVGIAFSDRRKSASAATIADIIFTKLNVA